MAGNPILSYENSNHMTTLVGLFFSFISLLGLLKGKSKKFVRKMVIIVFSFSLIVAQLLFMSSKLPIESQEFIAICGLLSGIIPNPCFPEE